MAPTAGTGVFVHENVAFEGRVQGRIMTDADESADRTSLAFAVGPRFFAARILSFGLDYGYAQGVYPYEGPGREEHLVQPGLRIGTASEGRKFALANRARVDLRTYREPGADWGFHVRPRNEVTLTGIIRPWMRVSMLAEGLLQPDLGSKAMLQVRSGLALHGRIDLVRGDRWRYNRAPPALHWLVSAQAGLRPVALARDTAADAVHDAAVDADRVTARIFETLPGSSSPREAIDLVITFGLAGHF